MNVSPSAPGSRANSTLASMLLALSGAAAIAHQILWTRRLVDVIGAGSDTFAKVVGALFVGFAIGGIASARWPSHPHRAWRRVAISELAIGLLALPIIFLPQFFAGTDLPVALLVSLKPLLPVLLIVPPAAAMGLVLPALLQVQYASTAQPYSTTGWLYAVNTAGGILGLVAFAWLALPALGIVQAGLLAAGINGCIAACAGVRACRERHEISPTAESQGLLSSSPQTLSQTLQGIAAFGSGYLVLAFEVILQHQLAQVSINSFFSTATVLAVVLLSLSLAAFAQPLVVRCLRPPIAIATASLLAAGAAWLQPHLFLFLRPSLRVLPYELPPSAYFSQLLTLSVLVAAPVLVFAGLLFPILLSYPSPGSKSKTRAAQLLAANGLGAWLGAEIHQAWITPTLGIWLPMAFIGLGYAVLALLFLPQSILPSRQAQLAAFVAVAALSLAAASKTRRLPQVRLQPDETLLDVRTDRDGVVATVASSPGDRRILFNNTYTLGGSRAAANQERQAALPILLHPNPKSVALLGVATGSTTAGATLFPSIHRIDAIELSESILHAATSHFSEFNRDIAQNPAVHLIHADARWLIAAQRETYDVVLGDLFLPWRTGEGRLFSLEHFAAVRRSLRPGGLYCQWVPLFQLTRPQFETIARTFLAVFPNAIALRGDFYTDLPILGLMASPDPIAPNWDEIERRCAALRIQNRTSDPLLRHSQGVAMLWLGSLPAPPPGPTNTLANGWLEWDAGKNIIGLQNPWFIGVPCAEYFRGIHQAEIAKFPEPWKPAHDAGQFFLTLEIATRLNLPSRANLESQVLLRLPTSLRTDRQADFKSWPMRAKPAL